jgi:hypothetical protein
VACSVVIVASPDMSSSIVNATSANCADGANEMLAIRGAGSLIDHARLRQPTANGG